MRFRSREFEDEWTVGPASQSSRQEASIKIVHNDENEKFKLGISPPGGQEGMYMRTGLTVSKDQCNLQDASLSLSVFQNTNSLFGAEKSEGKLHVFGTTRTTDIQVNVKDQWPVGKLFKVQAASDQGHIPANYHIALSRIPFRFPNGSFILWDDTERRVVDILYFNLQNQTLDSTNQDYSRSIAYWQEGSCLFARLEFTPRASKKFKKLLKRRGENGTDPIKKKWPNLLPFEIESLTARLSSQTTDDNGSVVWGAEEDDPPTKSDDKQ